MIAAVVIDTNVVVAGLLTSRTDSPVARILDGMLAAEFPFVVSSELLAEYRDVLNRPALRKLHGLGSEQVEQILVAIAEHAIVLSPQSAEPAPDPGDQHLWELLAVRSDLRLVTGDKLLLNSRSQRARIVTPASFVDCWN